MTDTTTKVVDEIKSHPDMMPMDPGCEYIKHLSVNKGVQGVLHVDGSDSLIYLVNPDDGREPYIVIRKPQVSLMETTTISRETEREDFDDD